MIEVKRKVNESIKSLLRRFSKKAQPFLLQARNSKFRIKDQNRKERRKSALRRNKIIAEKEKLRKLGKLEDELKFS